MSQMRFSANCSLTRYLDEVSKSELNNGKAQVAAAMLYFLGFFNTNRKTPDYRSLQGLMEMLVAERHESYLEEIRNPCAHCPAQADCLVGKVVLNTSKVKAAVQVPASDHNPSDTSHSS